MKTLRSVIALLLSLSICSCNQPVGQSAPSPAKINNKSAQTTNSTAIKLTAKPPRVDSSLANVKSQPPSALSPAINKAESASAQAQQPSLSAVALADDSASPKTKIAENKPIVPVQESATSSETAADTVNAAQSPTLEAKSAQTAPTQEIKVALNVPTSPPTKIEAAKTVDESLGITGTMQIDFGSRSHQKDGADVYTLDLTCADSVKIQGKITREGGVVSSILGREKKPMELKYDLSLSLLNPADRAQRQSAGSIKGSIAVSSEGLYSLSSLKLDSILPAQAAPLSGVFSGKIQGKSEEKHGLIGATYTRLFGAKKVTLKLKQVDPLRFTSLRLAGGPIELYPASRITGNFDYDYDTGNWLTSGISFQGEGSSPDKVTGSIKWSPDPKRDSNGKGQYEFNIRFNEDRFANTEDEGSFFESNSDEQAFFAVDERIPTLRGEIKYRDTFNGKDDDGEPVVVKSDIQYALTASQVTKQQLFNFLKLWLLIVGPVNDE